MNLKKIWKSKWKILDGVIHSLIINFTPKIKKQIKQRRALCANCNYLDLTGTGELTVVKGEPACGICGCNIKLLTASLSSECSLSDIGQEPKWKKI